MQLREQPMHFLLSFIPKLACRFLICLQILFSSYCPGVLRHTLNSFYPVYCYYFHFFVLCPGVLQHILTSFYPIYCVIYYRLFVTAFKLRPLYVNTAIGELFRRNQDIHTHNTRQQQNPHMVRRCTKAAARNLVHIGPKLWANLPVTHRENRTRLSFAKKCKTLLLERY